MPCRDNRHLWSRPITTGPCAYFLLHRMCVFTTSFAYVWCPKQTKSMYKENVAPYAAVKYLHNTHSKTTATYSMTNNYHVCSQMTFLYSVQYSASSTTKAEIDSYVHSVVHILLNNFVSCKNTLPTYIMYAKNKCAPLLHGSEHVYAFLLLPVHNGLNIGSKHSI